MGSFSVRGVHQSQNRKREARAGRLQPKLRGQRTQRTRVAQWRKPTFRLPISTRNSCRLREIAFRPHARLPLLRSLPYRVRNNTNMASPDKSPSKWSKASGSPVGNAMKMMSALKAAGAKLDVVDHDGPIGDDQHAAARANSEAHRVLSKREAERARTNAFHAQLAHVRNVQQSALRGGVHQSRAAGAPLHARSGSSSRRTRRNRRSWRQRRRRRRRRRWSRLALD